MEGVVRLVGGQGLADGRLVLSLRALAARDLFFLADSWPYRIFDFSSRLFGRTKFTTFPCRLLATRGRCVYLQLKELVNGGWLLTANKPSFSLSSCWSVESLPPDQQGSADSPQSWLFPEQFGTTFVGPCCGGSFFLVGLSADPWRFLPPRFALFCWPRCGHSGSTGRDLVGVLFWRAILSLDSSFPFFGYCAPCTKLVALDALPFCGFATFNKPLKSNDPSSLDGSGCLSAPLKPCL